MGVAEVMDDRLQNYDDAKTRGGGGGDETGLQWLIH